MGGAVQRVRQISAVSAAPVIELGVQVFVPPDDSTLNGYPKRAECVEALVEEAQEIGGVGEVVAEGELDLLRPGRADHDDVRLRSL